MQDRLKLSYIGLPEQEVKILKNMISHVPRLKDGYLFSDSDVVPGSDIVLVNGDDIASINLWSEMSRTNHFSTALVISTSGLSITNSITLQRPFKIQGLIDSLEEVAEDRTIRMTPTTEPDPESRLQILVVDDSYTVRKYMEKKLSELIEVPALISFAANGEEALIKFNQRKYDMAFVDINMPGIDGYQVCKAFNALRDIHIVILTSNKSPIAKLRGAVSGCSSFISKPPSDERLIGEVRECLKNQFKNKQRTKQNKLAKGLRQILR